MRTRFIASNVYIRHVNVLTLVHGDRGGPSLFAEVAESRGDRIVEVRLHRGELPPGPPADYGAVLAMGGKAHPHEEDAYPWLRDEVAYLERVLAAGVPTLGVCLGAQLLVRAAGGRVEASPEPEIGWFPVELTDEAGDDAVFGELPRRFSTFQWHEYSAGVPPGGVELARSPGGPQAYRLGTSVWGVQFHPEVRHEQLVSWIESYGDSAPVPPDGFIAAAGRNIEASNELGRALCARFLATAEDQAR
jgi:GMP synthase-like glutamine amidotransferase